MSVRKFLKKAGISLAVLLILGIVSELVARAAEPGPFTLLDRRPYLDDPELDHVHKRNFRGGWDGSWYETDSEGLRGRDLAPSLTAEEFRVLAIGDSCTFGKGVDEADSWPRQFERLLAAEVPPGRRVLVANAGVNGYSPSQYLKVLRQRAPALKPHLIVIGYNLNDFPNQTKALDEMIHQGKTSLRSKIPRDTRNFLGRFAAFRWMRASYYVMNRERDYAAAEAMADAVKFQSQRYLDRVQREIGRIEDMAREAQAVDAQLCLFLFPYESQIYLETYNPASVDWLRGLCEERRIPFVSMIDEFRARARASDPPKQLFLRGDRYHPNAEGYALVATKILEAVRARGWVPRAE